MRQWLGVCMWEVLATTVSVVILLCIAESYLTRPQDPYTVIFSMQCPSSRPCIRKCCPRDQELQQPNPNITSGCFPTTISHFTISEIPQDNEGNVWTNDTFDILYQNCVKTDPQMDGDIVLLLANGSVEINGKEVHPVADYCIDYKRDRTYVFLCTHEEEYGVDAVTEGFILGYLVSAGGLLLTTVVYLVIATNDHVQRSLQINPTHLSVLLNYLPTLFLAYVLLAVIYENLYNLNIEHPYACRSIAFIVQFSFLASFFWLNVMCFDIWLVFSDLKPAQGRKHKKFLLYSLYAWGVPMVIVGISVAMDTIPGLPDTWIRPRFGEEKCWFADNKGTLIYFYLPIAVVVVTNIIMFVSTAIKLRAHTRATKVLNTSESRRTNESDRDRFNLYLKLFIIMGINWVMELVSFFVGGPKSLWFVTDLGNTLQGVLIFIIFVCKPRILRLLNEKLCPRWQIFRNASTAGRSKVSPSRTNSTTVTKTISEIQDSVALKPLARYNQSENDD